MLDFNEYPKSKPLAISPDQDFAEAMAANGFNPGRIVADGKLNRFDLKKPGDKAGWYVFHNDNLPAGSFGDWQSGAKHKWSARPEETLTPYEREQYRQRVEDAEKQRQEERARLADAARRRSQTVWAKAKPATRENGYLQRKKVDSYGLKETNRGLLIVPARDMFGGLQTLQFIRKDGRKLFLKDGAKRGNYNQIPGGPDVFICEGYATGATIREATGGTVVIAFDAGNLRPVAENIKAKYLQSRITICADNDQWTLYHDGRPNPGLILAKEAADAIGAALVFPQFANVSTRPTDFNDLAALEGIDAVKKQFNRGKGSGFRFIHVAEVIQNLRPIVWDIEGVQPSNSLYSPFGDPGSFKTFIELDKGLCIASGIPFHGHATRQGTVFYICGEGQQGIGRRIAVWFIAHKIKANTVPFFVAQTPMQLSDQANVEEVMRAIDAMAAKYGQPALVIIDTLARNFGDGDENSTKDMGLCIQNLDRHFGNDFCRCLIHHTGHANKDRGRGSIALKGAVDTEFRVSLTQNDQILMECTKQKDAPKAAPMLFNKREIKLLIGDVYDSSLVLDLAAEGEDISKPAPMSDTMNEALQVLQEMGGDLAGADYRDWRSRCLQKGLYKRTDNFNKAADKMRKSGLIQWDLLKNTVSLCQNPLADPGGN